MYAEYLFLLFVGSGDDYCRYVFSVIQTQDVEATTTTSDTSLTLSTSDIALAFDTIDVNGTFSASEPGTISVSTNNYTGYTLSIKFNDARLVNIEDDNYYISSISSAVAPAGFTNNTWGLLPSKFNSANNTLYQPVMAINETVIDTTSVANSTANKYTVTLGAKVDYALLSGTYQGAFTVSAVANPVDYAVSYDKNTTDTVSNMPTNQSGEVGSAEVILSNKTPTRAGYTFINWCAGNVTTTSGVDSCGGATYAPGATFDTDKTKSNTLALKAMWKRTFTLNFSANGGSGTMSAQTFYGSSATIKSNSFTRVGYTFTGWNTASNGSGASYGNGGTYTAPTSGTSITLYAQWRVAYMQEYTKSLCSAQASSGNVTIMDRRDSKTYTVRYINGNCWMTQNLRLAKGTTLTSTYSNVSSSYTIPNTDLSAGGNYNAGQSHDSGGTTYGYWYNYCAASAGTVCNNTQKKDAAYDLCPKGWRLPTSAEAGTVINYQSAFSPVAGGYWYYLGDLRSNSYGYWWTSTAYDAGGQYYLNYVDSSYLEVRSNTYGKYYGYYIRCIRAS